MNIEIVSLLEIALPGALAILFFCLHKYRKQESVKHVRKHRNNRKMLLGILLITEVLKISGIVLLIFISYDFLPVFVALYILCPLFIALHMIFFDTEYLKGVMMTTKGIYYIGLTITSITQVFLSSANLGRTALGFTLSLAIFESVSSLYDGYKTIQATRSSAPESPDGQATERCRS